MKPRLLSLAALFFALALAACGPGSAPQLIGSYSRTGPAVPPPNVLIVYSTYLTLDVADVDAAAERATQYASDYGGYLAESRAWYQDGRKYAALTLAVPAPNFDSLRQALLGLGTLVSESLSGDPKPINTSDWNTYSHITLNLQPAPPAISLPPLPTLGWNPGRTLAQAFGVSFTIFAFVVDVLIWLVVVLGPFALVGWVARALWRRLRRTSGAGRQPPDSPRPEGQA